MGSLRSLRIREKDEQVLASRKVRQRGLRSFRGIPWWMAASYLAGGEGVVARVEGKSCEARGTEKEYNGLLWATALMKAGMLFAFFVA